MTAIRTVTFANVLYSLSPAGPGHPDPKPRAIELMGATELVPIYNLVASNLGQRPVNKFADAATARKRTWAKLVEYDEHDFDAEGGEARPEPVDEKLKPKAEPVDEKPKAERKKRGMRFVFPAEDTIKPIRPDSARGKALAVLSQSGGGTFAEVQAATGWNEKRAYEGIRLLHYYSGYGLGHAGDTIDPETTKIRVFTKSKK